jgi:N6-L-threonylcarbamoyladenine synthase
LSASGLNARDRHFPLLAVETSCDESAVAIVDAEGRVLSNLVHSQVEAHAPYGGVVPEIASRHHLQRISALAEMALKEAGLAPGDLGAVAATFGPGLVGALLVGLSFAKSMAQALDRPFIGIHHLEGHLLAATQEPDFPPAPFIGLIASGGHSAIYLYRGLGQVETLGQTRDDAAGEAFDKAAKLLGLGYPGGPVVDLLADKGDASRFVFPISLRARTTYDLSFSGLKTALRVRVEALRKEKGDLDEKTVWDLCAGLRRAVVDALLNKAFLAARRKQIPHLVLGGGVAANSLLRDEAKRRGEEMEVAVFIPPRSLCTDNAAMIAQVARARILAGQQSVLSLNANPGAALQDASLAATSMSQAAP